jgi:hypothetical protein
MFIIYRRAIWNSRAPNRDEIIPPVLTVFDDNRTKLLLHIDLRRIKITAHVPTRYREDSRHEVWTASLTGFTGGTQRPLGAMVGEIRGDLSVAFWKTCLKKEFKPWRA